MGVNIELKHLDNIFKLKKTGNRGWYSTDCPYCGKHEHLGINFGGVGAFNCFKCGEKGTIFKLLKFVGKLHIISDIKTVDLNKTLEPKILINNQREDIVIDLKKRLKPLGFRKITDSEYIYSRGISEDIFHIYEIGTTKLDSKLKDYLIFLFYYNSVLIGWIARTTLSQKQISGIEKATGKKYLRYINAPDVDFSKYLFGIEEINENTHTVILVEGIFDKFKTDTNLDLYYSDEMKCCACFGKKISDYQIFLLQQKNIKNIILLYDNDAVSESKTYANELYKYFDVKVGYCKKSDPGDMDIDELAETFSELKSPLDFQISMVSKKKLK